VIRKKIANEFFVTVAIRQGLWYDWSNIREGAYRTESLSETAPFAAGNRRPIRRRFYGSDTG
jgi:hypothetical protein